MKTPKSFNSVLPLNKEKRNFFKALVKIYESADAIAEYGGINTNTTRIAHLSEIILAFLNGEYIAVLDTTSCTNLKEEVINKMRPIRKDKVAIYNALVCYMDELMGGIANGSETELVSTIIKDIPLGLIANVAAPQHYLSVCGVLFDAKDAAYKAENCINEDDAANNAANDTANDADDTADDADPNIIYVVTCTKDFTDEVLECEPEVFKTRDAAFAYISEEFNKIINGDDFDPNENTANIIESDLNAFIYIYGDWYKWETKTFDLTTLK